MDKSEYDALDRDAQIAIHRLEIEAENRTLQLTEAELLQCEHEVHGAMEINFGDWNDDKVAPEFYAEWLEKAQEVYWDRFCENMYQPRPLKKFQSEDTEPDKYNAAGSLSGALIEIARINLNLPRELTEI